MKTLIVIVFVILSAGSVARTLKSAEALPSDSLNDRQEERMEAQEEQKVREDWDRQEHNARVLEERKRIHDEQKAENPNL